LKRLSQPSVLDAGEMLFQDGLSVGIVTGRADRRADFVAGQLGVLCP
jgi:hypothetical protein